MAGKKIPCPIPGCEETLRRVKGNAHWVCNGLAGEGDAYVSKRDEGHVIMVMFRPEFHQDETTGEWMEYADG